MKYFYLKKKINKDEIDRKKVGKEVLVLLALSSAKYRWDLKDIFDFSIACIFCFLCFFPSMFRHFQKFYKFFGSLYTYIYFFSYYGKQFHGILNYKVALENKACMPKTDTASYFTYILLISLIPDLGHCTSQWFVKT